MSSGKCWGKAPFWGVSSDFDPQWMLDEEQKRIQQMLIDLCRTVLRPNAVVSDETYEYPRKNLDALASIGLLGLIVPKEMGGLGQNHVGASMVVETIARYGCPSTAMVYVMHVAAVATLLFRCHDNPTIQFLLKRLDKDKFVGTICYSDPTTGGHFWYPLSSRTKYHKESDSVQMLKYSSWATSAGFADFYIIQTVSPDFAGDYSNLSVFLLYQDEIRADTADWSALGMHGNQSGPVICETTLTKNRVVGPFGDGAFSNDECVDPYFLLLSSCCWNGISLGCVDIAKKHVTTKQHADVGMRVADYPTIQDYIGEAMIETNACRLMVLNVAQGMDKETQNNNWSLHSDPSFLPRTKFLHWCWQLKFASAKNVSHVTDKMLHTCGGTGYKTDLGIERLLRDGKAAWVMGPSNEVLRQFVGNSVLFGLDVIDYWVQTPNPRVLNSELKKMTNDQKVVLAQKILKEVAMNDPTKAELDSYQDSEFDNPFNTRPPATVGTYKTPDGVEHAPALSPDKFTEVKLISVKHFTDKQAMFEFALPHPTDHTGCLPGQYVQVRVDRNGKPCQRYFSPVTGTKEFGKIGLVIKFESHGQLSICLKNLKPGDLAMMRAPCGGYEYVPNTTKHLSLLASGGGVTPCVQLLRDIMKNPDDKTRVSLLYYAETEAEFLFKEELDAYVTQDKRLNVFYSIKDGAEFENWKGGDGYLNGEMIKAHIPAASETSHKILVCGGPSMIITVLQYMLEIGYQSEDIFVYGQFGVEQVRSIYGRNAKISTHRVQ